MKFLALLFVLFFTPQTQVLNVSQVEQILKVSVLVRAKQYYADERTSKIHKGISGCSGTFIGPHTVLTAAHCFSYPTTEIWVRGFETKSMGAYLVKLDEKRDLALLEVVGEIRHPHVKLASQIHIGEQVCNVGSPMRLEFLVSEGIIAALNWNFKDFIGSYIITTAMINPGSSGGGAFNEKGELIGVNTMTVGSPFGWSGISVAVDIKTIREFLK